MTNLKEVDLSRCSKITDAGIKHLLSVPSLEKLCISETGVTADGVTVLASLTNLLVLDLGGLPVTDSALSSLQDVCLEKIILSGATIRDVSEAFQYVETSKICLLDMSNSSILSFTFLCSMDALTDLNLSDCALVDDSIDHVARVGANLRHLNLSNAKVSSDGIGALAGHVPNLEILLLSDTPIDDKSILYISMMPSLKIINLSRTNVKGLICQDGDDDVLDEVPSFSALESLGHLESLYLENLHIKDAAVFPVLKLHRLSYLSLQSVSLTATSLHHIPSTQS